MNIANPAYEARPKTAADYSGSVSATPGAFGLERLRNLQLFRPTSGMWANLGMRIVEARTGEAVVEGEFSLDAHGRRGSIHRGAIAAVADGALACAAGTLIAEGEVATTVELSVDFYQPIAAGRVVATGRVRDRAGHLVYCAAAVEQDGHVVAESRATIALVKPS